MNTQATHGEIDLCKSYTTDEIGLEVMSEKQ